MDGFNNHSSMDYGHYNRVVFRAANTQQEAKRLFFKTKLNNERSIFMQIMKRLFALLSLVFLMNSPSYADTKTVRYIVHLAGNQAGTQITEIVSDAERRVSFEFNDRGRGPKLATRILLTPNHIPLLIETSGDRKSTRLNSSH